MKKIFIPLAILIALCFLFIVFQPKEDISHSKPSITLVKPPAHILTPYPKSFLDSSFIAKNQQMGIVVGTPADDVHKIRGKPPYPSEIVGKDANGLIVEWEYPDGIYIMRRWTINGITCYRVTEMKS